MKKNLQSVLLHLLLCCSVTLLAQQRIVTGNVTSADEGSSMPGVNVTVRGTSQGTVTDSEGNFTLSVSTDEIVLVFSFIGYTTQEIAMGNRNSINVVLAPDVRHLSEVVVVGYGTQERRELTGSVSSINSSAIENLVTASFDSQLAGRAPGVQVTTPGGILGQRPIIRIRGVNSITNSADPLIVIDGVPVVSEDRSSVMAANPLGNINPADIESFEVLKDGSATAIFGSRAANGVILITTKRGVKGKGMVDYSTSFGINEEVSRFDLLDGNQFVTIANEKRSNANATELANPGVNTDWQDHIFRKGFVQQHNISVRGGSDATNYYFSLGFMDQEAAILVNDMRRYSFRGNIDHSISSRIRLGASTSYAFTELNGLNNGANLLSGAIYNATKMPPNVAIFDPANTAFDGFNVQPDGSTLGWGANNAGPDNNIPNIAFVLANNILRNRSHRIIGNAYGEVDILEGLTLRSQIGVDLTLSEDFLSWDPRHGDGRGRDGLAEQAFRPASRWNWQNTLNYQTVLADVHNLNITVGAEYQYSTFYNFTATGQGFSDRFFHERNLISGSYSVQTINGGYVEQGFDSYFGRVNYSYRGKYLLSFALRNDGISSLPITNRRGTFPGGSVGWRISDEDFFDVPLISELKLRASYAEVGNTEIGAFPSVGGFGAVLYGPNPGIAFGNVSNTALQWESSRKFNVGLNMMVGGVSIEMDYFKNNIDDMILDAPVAPSLGIPGNSISQNIGSMVNQGMEFRVSAKVLEINSFTWNTDFNFTYMTNEVTSLVNPITGVRNRTEVGRSIGELYGFRWAGVNPANGNPMYFKADGSIVQYNLVTEAAQRTWRVYNPSDPTDISQSANAPGSNDLDFLGNTLPKWFGGWTNKLSYGNFDFEVFLRFSGGNYIMNETLRDLMGMGFANNHASIMNRWTEAGMETDVPKLFSGQGANIWQTNASNSRFVEKGDFVRFQNIILGYKVPSLWLNNTFNGGIRSARIFAQVQNPFIITSYSGLDPELNVSNNQLSFGTDFNGAPIIRTYSIGLNVGF